MRQDFAADAQQRHLIPDTKNPYSLSMVALGRSRAGFYGRHWSTSIHREMAVPTAVTLFVAMPRLDAHPNAHWTTDIKATIQAIDRALSQAD
jgi:hypothetical protein